MERAASAVGTAPPSGKVSKTWADRIALAVLIVLVIILAVAFTRRFILGADRFTIDRTRPVLSQVDGLRYRVHANHSSPQRAADMLAKLNGRIIALMRALRTTYVRGPAGELHPDRRAAVQRLLARYNPDNLAENSPRDPSGDTAYSLDKGALVAVCLREKHKSSGDVRLDDLHDLNTLTFVTFHEMGHIAIDEVDHPKKFWEAFRFLLEEAETAGIYYSPNFAQRPVEYCGVTVDYNPRWDSSTSPI
jgi:hypothetical protein